MTQCNQLSLTYGNQFPNYYSLNSLSKIITIIDRVYRENKYLEYNKITLNSFSKSANLSSVQT